jgi:hypothetical protein
MPCEEIRDRPPRFLVGTAIAGPIGAEGKGARLYGAGRIDGGFVAANLDGYSLWLCPGAHTVSVWVETPRIVIINQCACNTVI